MRKKLAHNPHDSQKFQNGHEKNILTIIPYKTNLAHKFYATLENFQTIPKNFKTVSEKNILMTLNFTSTKGILLPFGVPKFPAFGRF